MPPCPPSRFQQAHRKRPTAHEGLGQVLLKFHHAFHASFVHGQRADVRFTFSKRVYKLMLQVFLLASTMTSEASEAITASTVYW